MAQQGLRLLMARCGVAVHAFQAADWALLLSLSSRACQEDYARATALGLGLDPQHGGPDPDPPTGSLGPDPPTGSLDLDPDPARAGQHDAATVQGSSACQHAQVPGGFAPGSSGQQQQLQKVQVHVGHVPSRIVVPQQQQLPGGVVASSPLPLHFTAARLAVRRKLDGFVAGVLDAYRPTLGGGGPVHAVEGGDVHAVEGAASPGDLHAVQGAGSPGDAGQVRLGPAKRWVRSPPGTVVARW